MADHAGHKQDEKGLSARYLILVFLVGVAACAVFFSLGFLVGYGERSSKTVSSTEQVSPTGIVPPTINPPPATTPATSQPPPAAGSDLSTEQISIPEPAAKQRQERAKLTKPEPPPTKATAKPTSSKSHRRRAHRKDGGYTVQVAASRTKQDATKLVKELRSRGFDVFVVTPESSDENDDLYRIQVGPFATRGEAARVRERIAKEGFKPFIKR